MNDSLEQLAKHTINIYQWIANARNVEKHVVLLYKWFEKNFPPNRFQMTSARIASGMEFRFYPNNNSVNRLHLFAKFYGIDENEWRPIIKSLLSLQEKGFFEPIMIEKFLMENL